MEVKKTYAEMEQLKQEILDNRGKDHVHVLECCTKIREYAQREQNVELNGFACYYSGEAYYLLNDVENMFCQLGNGIPYLEQSRQWNLIIRAYNLMAIMSDSRGNVASAMDYYLMALRYCREHDMVEIESSITLNLGSLYMENGVYEEALDYLARAYEYYIHTPEEKQAFVTLIMIYTNMAICYMNRGLMTKAKACIDRLDEECGSKLRDFDYIYVYCMKAGFYHRMENDTMLKQCMEEVVSRIDKEVSIMDLFDDLYSFCKLMLETDHTEVFLKIYEKLEAMAKKAGIANLQKKLLSLKIEYYKKNNMEKEYLTEAGKFYELTEAIEQERQNAVLSMLYVRKSLEKADENRRRMEELNRKLLERSETDPMTGLANRYRLSEYSERMLEECRERQIALAVEIIDIDCFKQYNDTYGHQAGDECIVAVANELKSRENDQVFCARYGGDEFIIIYTGFTPEEVCEKAEDLRQCIMRMKLEREELQDAQVTISQGICYNVPRTGNKNWDFLHQADIMLYRVKKAEKNNICMSDLYGQELFAGAAI